MFLKKNLAIQIVLVYSVNFHRIMQHLNNIFLNFQSKILKIERVIVNLRRQLEKQLFCGVHHNSQQNQLKQKNQNSFVKGDVSRVNSGRIFFFSIFQFFVALGSQKNRFSLKNRLICYCKINNYQKKLKSSQGYLVNDIKKCCAKFQNNWSSRF